MGPAMLQGAHFHIVKKKYAYSHKLKNLFPCATLAIASSFLAGSLPMCWEYSSSSTKRFLNVTFLNMSLFFTPTPFAIWVQFFFFHSFSLSQTKTNWAWIPGPFLIMHCWSLPQLEQGWFFSFFMIRLRINQFLF